MLFCESTRERKRAKKGGTFPMPDFNKKAKVLQRGQNAIEALEKLRRDVEDGTISTSQILDSLDLIIQALPAIAARLQLTEGDQLLSTREAAEALGISAQALYGRISRGTLPNGSVIRSENGRRFFIRKSALGGLLQ